jgi:C4-dicarboxylate transporter, DctQ subunit
VARRIFDGEETFRMSNARQLLKWLGDIELWTSVAAFILVVVISSLQILLRSAFGLSIIWAQEVSQLAMLVTYFLGAAYIYKQRQYMVVEFLTNMLPRSTQYWLYLFAQVLTLAFSIMMVAMIVEIAPAQLRMKTFLLHIPRFYSSLPVLIGSLSMALTATYYLVATVRAGGVTGQGASIQEIESASNPFYTNASREIVL